jgi:PTH1 family peptidyl-tRNA hydrolase
VTRHLIVGLGNPGPRYASNRHNLGCRCVEELALANGLSFNKTRRGARLALGRINRRRSILAKPQTYMNESGLAVAGLARYYRIPPESVLVVHDDLDIDLGTLRLRPEGGSGGHKGMQSIIQHLGSQAFPRLRLGIGRPPGRMDPADYVLQDFSSQEEELVADVIQRAVAAIETWLHEGTEAAMDRHNRRV